MPSKVYHSKSKNTPTGKQAYIDKMGDVPSPLPPETGVTLEEHPAFAGAKPKDDPMAWLDEAKAKATTGKPPELKTPKAAMASYPHIVIGGAVLRIHWKGELGNLTWGLSHPIGREIRIGLERKVRVGQKVLWIGRVDKFIDYCTLLITVAAEWSPPTWHSVIPWPQRKAETEVIHILPKAEPKPQKIAATADHTVRAWYRDKELKGAHWVGDTLYATFPDSGKEVNYPPANLTTLLDRGTMRIEGYMPKFYQRRKPVDVPAMMAEIKGAFEDEEPIARKLSEDGYELRVKSKFVDLVVTRNGRVFSRMVGSTVTGVSNDGTLEGAIRKVAA